MVRFSFMAEGHTAEWLDVSSWKFQTSGDGDVEMYCKYFDDSSKI